MDPLTITAVTSAIAAGAAASLKDTASAAVKDAYAGLKALLVRRYASVDLSPVEKKPESELRRAVLEEDLAEVGAGDDHELLALGLALADAVAKDAPQVAPAIGIDLEKVKADFLRVGFVDAQGTGVKVRESEFTGGISIEAVRAGKEVRSQTGPQ